MRASFRLLLLVVSSVLASCTEQTKVPPFPHPVTPQNHPFFPIGAGAKHELGQQLFKADAPVACDSCHPAGAESFAEISCTSCHGHEEILTGRLHGQTALYAFESKACVSCHPASDEKAYDHAGITGECAMCHDVETPFAALPVANFTHPAMSGADCVGCHVTSTWRSATGAPAQLTFDPARSVVVRAWAPTYSGLDISLVTPIDEVVPMTMDHASPELATAAKSACSNCHQGAASGVFFPGALHSSLANLTLAQPTRCDACHGAAAPRGFVGPLATNPARSPASPEMKHDAVQWTNGAPTTTALVPTDCGACHLAPGTQGVTTWAAGRLGTSPALYHSALEASGRPQPGSCIDCHANTRPARLLTSANATMPATLQFDHAAPLAQADCATCHAASTAAPFASWSGALFHVAGSSTPASCLPCHAARRPTATTGWTEPGYATAPFDYGTNGNGVTHGAGLDCVTCHAGPGAGQWGGTHDWARGHFTHGPATLSATTCLTCHATQRPDLVLGASQANTAVGFDHALNGSGDCFGCHQATVTANTYARYFNATTATLPNGDWKGGVPYPGSTFASSATRFITVTQTKLTRPSPTSLVTGMTSSTATLPNGMLHVSAQVPAALNAGATGSPDNTRCWHCHTSTGTTVTAFNDGKFHAALTSYSATPGGTVVPFAQPVRGCADCHSTGLPTDIVERDGGVLVPMDHAAQFTQAVTLGGASVTAVNQVDCSVCHHTPGGAWSDGVFHASIGASVPKDCVGCHYPLMADAAKADHAQGTTFAMKHRSSQLASQRCDTCHLAALGQASTIPVAAALWATGVLHPSVTPQPAACVDCHGVSQPPPNLSTQGTVTWALPRGATPTNTMMWMNHGAPLAAGRECAQCHAADAKTSGSAWNKAGLFHAPTPGATACAACHGLGNGRGATPGTNNNLPSGLTDSSTLTSASASTGVSGQPDQLTHQDANVGTRDCAFCHSSVTDWRLAKFHANFNSATPLTLNGGTARCSNCHMNVKPGAGFAAQDHATFTSTAGTQDCSSCHSWPGTGTTAAPNWLGATGAPQFIAVGGFTISSPPATAGTTQPAVMNLPHPSGPACITCHASSGGGQGAFGYDHASPLINSNCGACHEAGSGLVGTAWNGATSVAAGAGDTRPFTLASLVAHFGAGLTVTRANHFYPADCGQCHLSPAGTGAVTTGAAYATAWRFPHDQALMANPGTCLMCHVNGIPGAPDGGVADPNANITVSSLVPRFTATTISAVTPLTEVVPMTMVHSSTEYPAAANGACSNCHTSAASGVYYPGELHSALANLGLAQPTGCASCHAAAAPSGFVGPLATSPARTPATGEMRHEAVRWSNGSPTTTALVSTNCGQCHASPSATLQATWGMSADAGAVRYHASLGAQPTSCLDCHANSRANGLLTSMNAALGATVQFDHGTTTALGDCADCHASSTSSPWASWTGGRFHLAGASTPASCLPCHAAARPTSTTGWASTTYTQAPFDYGTNASGVTHGDGLDCVSCHAGPGTGAWGSTQNWQGGHFAHGPTTVAAATCLTCHSTQRPDLVLGVSQANTAVGFDHAANGTGDCVGCHQATVVANTYARYFNAGTGLLPNGDWKGGQTYPGSSLVSAPTQFVSLTGLALTRNATNFVTGMTSTTSTLYNAMLHVSSVVPAALNAGPTGTPDNTKCWHCHTHSGTTVTSFADGKYHASLTTYAATPGGTVAPFAQPTTACRECHATMYPPNIVEKAASSLQPMDHAAEFLTAVTLGGNSVTRVDQVDCSVCHRAPGSTWSDGLFHANIGAATPKDCVGCHYPLVADAAKADLTSGVRYAMKHRSPLLVVQKCESCHATALSRATTASHAATLWQTGALHASLTPQPTACTDCHAVSEPAANASTQSTVTYTLPLGRTTSNGAQWNNHGSVAVAGKDCVTCHAADAKTSGSAWSRSTPLHPAATTTVCANCHGTTNGKGTVLGTNNNLPSGLSNSSTLSASAGAVMTGIPAGTFAQLTHADVNVTSFDCATCHTQKGTSTTAGVQGKEWAQAQFHAHFSGATALVMNTTTGRCSNCHFAEKPGVTYLAQDHATFTATAASQDCSSCHSWPGTGTASTPNWLGAAGVPQFISVGGFTISQPPATAVTTQAGITKLPHPTVAVGTPCTTCHASSAGGKQADGYDHASTLITTACNACHEAGTDLLGTVWNGAATIAAGAGDSRPFTATALTATFSGNTCRFTNPNHFFPVNCRQCHTAPTGIVTTSTGTAYKTKWAFVHKESNMTNPATCNLCHNTCPKG